MNTITINDEFGYDNYEYLNDLLSYTLKQEKVNNAVFSVIFVDNNEIQRLNREYRNIDKITDVISFAFEDTDTMVYNDLRVLGDIFISIPKMIDQAKEYGHSEKRELSFLAVHGLLHLLGYDHMNEEDEKEMFDLQEMILDANNIKR